MKTVYYKSGIIRYNMMQYH